MDAASVHIEEKSSCWGVLCRCISKRPYAALAVLFFLAMAVPFHARKVSEWDDVYVRAAGNIWQGRDIYQREDGYLYPPFMAWLALPFAMLPGGIQRLLFYALNVTCITYLCRWAWMLSGGRRLHNPATPRSEHLIFILGLACAFRYVVDGLAHQQVDVVIGCVVLGGCVALSRSRFWLGATAFGVAAAMKCTALLWLPYLLWRRRWLPAAWLAVVAVGLNFLPHFVSSAPGGKAWAVEWVTRLVLPLAGRDAVPGEWGSDIIFNQSLAGLWNRYCETRLVWTDSALDVIRRSGPLSTTALKAAVYGSAAVLLLAALMVLRRRRAKISAAETDDHFPAFGLEFSMILLSMLLLSPMSSKPHFCTLLLPAFCLARQTLAGDRPAAVLLGLAIITCGLSIRGIWGETTATFGLWWGSVTWSTLCLFAGCWYALLRARRAGEGTAVHGGYANYRQIPIELVMPAPARTPSHSQVPLRMQETADALDSAAAPAYLHCRHSADRRQQGDRDENTCSEVGE